MPGIQTTAIGQTPGDSHWKYHTSYNQGLRVLCRHFSPPLLWSPQRCGIFQAGVEGRMRSNQFRTQVRSGASLSSQDRSDYRSLPWLTSSVRTGVCCQYISWGAVWQLRGRFSTNAKLSGRMLTTVSITWARLGKVQFSSVLSEILFCKIIQLWDYDKPWFMTDYSQRGGIINGQL